MKHINNTTFSGFPCNIFYCQLKGNSKIKTRLNSLKMASALVGTNKPQHTR